MTGPGRLRLLGDKCAIGRVGWILGSSPSMTNDGVVRTLALLPGFHDVMVLETRPVSSCSGLTRASMVQDRLSSNWISNGATFSPLFAVSQRSSTG